MTKRVVDEGMFAPVEAGVSSEGIPDSLDWVKEGKVRIKRFHFRIRLECQSHENSCSAAVNEIFASNIQLGRDSGP